jgi:hypothetical protein
MSEFRLPCWSWGGGAPGGWRREYLEWLGRYRHTGSAEDAPSWSCWLEDWPDWSLDQRLVEVRSALRSSGPLAAEMARHAHRLRSRQPSTDKREWSRLAVTKRLAAGLTLPEVRRG